jgi:hypothetical protein
LYRDTAKLCIRVPLTYLLFFSSLFLISAFTSRNG